MDYEVLKYLVSPIICALIGWFTNYLAVKMLFHPRKPINLGLFTIQGTFPKRQAALARNLGNMIENELVSHDDLAAVLDSPEFCKRISVVADPYIDEFVSEKLTSLHPMVGMFLTGEMVDKVKGLLSDQIGKIAPSVVARVGAELEQSLDFSETIRQRIEAFSMDKLEEILFSIMRREFKFIELMGGVLGFVIGVLQSVILYLL